MDNCNPVTRAISQAVAGTIPVTAMFVRGQFGADLDPELAALGALGDVRGPPRSLELGELTVDLERDLGAHAVTSHGSRSWGHVS